jgi:urocanate hydratase
MEATISLQAKGNFYEILPTLKKTNEVPELLSEHAGAHGRDDGSQ